MAAASADFDLIGRMYCECIVNSILLAKDRRFLFLRIDTGDTARWRRPPPDFDLIGRLYCECIVNSLRLAKDLGFLVLRILGTQLGARGVAQLAAHVTGPAIDIGRVIREMRVLAVLI